MNNIAKTYWTWSWRRVRTGEGRFLHTENDLRTMWSDVYIEKARKCHRHRYDRHRRSVRLGLAVLRNDEKTGRRMISQVMVRQFYDELTNEIVDNPWNKVFLTRGAEA